MARIPDTELDRMKTDISVEQLVRTHGVDLTKSGKDWRGRCVFHEDSTPSLVVTPSKNLWHCFGCGLGGGPVDWVMKANGISFRHAVELLREGHPSLAANVAAKEMSVRSTVRVLEAPVKADADDAALLAQVVDYYHQTMKGSPEALAYLEKRGIAAAVEHFRLGYANRTLGLRLPLKNREAGAALRTRLQAVGVLRESGHEHLNGCVVFPWFDDAGAVAGLYGRKILDNLRAGTAYHLYLPGAHRGVFNAAGLRGQKEVIVCEAIIDALTFWCAGYTNVTASFGAEGLLHQYQREVKTVRHAGAELAYIEVTVGDIESANALVHEVLGRSLDELPPVTRRVLDQIVAAVKAKPLPRASVRFSRREVREWTGASDTQAKLHLSRLAELEYLLIHRAARGQGFEYELMYDGDSTDAAHLSGLIDTARLDCVYDARRSGVMDDRSGRGRGEVGPLSAGGRVAENPAEAGVAGVSGNQPMSGAELHVPEDRAQS